MRPTGAGRQRWYVWPVIVPPIYSKHSLIQSFIPSVWSEAREALSSSDRVVFCGYSLPAADIEAEKLVQRSLGSNLNLPWIGVIDPAPGVAGRYVGLLPDKPLRRFPNIDAFLGGEAFDA